MRVIVVVDGPKDSAGNTPFTKFWPNDVICDMRPTPVRAQVFRSDIEKHVAQMRDRGYAVEVRKSDRGVYEELTPATLVYDDNWRGPRA